MGTTRLTYIQTIVFEHPSAGIQLDERVCEVNEGTRLGWQWHRTIREPTEITPELDGPARFVTVTNMAGSDIERYLSDEQAAALNRQTLLVGPPEKPDLCLLRPRDVPMGPRGECQSFWLAPGARLVMSPGTLGESVHVKVVAFTGAANGIVFD